MGRDMRRVGIDLVEVGRIRRILEQHGPRFLDRVYTPREIDYCAGRVTSLAARWAAKEAVAKALGCGLGAVHWLEIEVLNDHEGGPSLALHGEALKWAERLNLTQWSISLSHTKEYAVAFVVAS